MPSDSTIIHGPCGKSVFDCTCPPYKWEDGKRTGGCGCNEETCATAFEFVCDSLRLISERLRSIESKLSL